MTHCDGGSVVELARAAAALLLILQPPSSITASALSSWNSRTRVR